MYQDIAEKNKSIAVVGLGYVGLPIALAFARRTHVVGFDINAERVELLKQRHDPSGELPASAFDGCDIDFSADPDELRAASFYIVAVPTPIDEHNSPDLEPLLLACETIARVLKPGDYVVFESTVYPGCTEEDCVPILERSGLHFKTDFKVGYSPERINPGDQEHTLANTVKVVSGCDDEALQTIYAVYALAVEGGLHKASSIKVAEAAKIIENTQRDLNIALMNELSLIFDKMSINTYEVIEAAATKWNFQKYYPGLVGGHCIGVDPYYLTHKASSLGYHAQVILAGRSINDSMGAYVGGKVVKKMIKAGKDIIHTRVLVMGLTFKENVTDIRNSKVVDLVRELAGFHVQVEITDPHADPDEVRRTYGLELTSDLRRDYDAVVVAVAHREFAQLDEDYFLGLTNENALFADIKGVFRDKIHRLNYWSL